MDYQVIDILCAQITEPIEYITTNKMYDTDAVFQIFDDQFLTLTLLFLPKIICLLMQAIILKG